jgi:type II secretory pathway component PulF
VKVGESSGSLTQNLQYLADELNKRSALRRKVVGALVYPAFITTATLGITSLLTVFIFPKILPIFSSLNVELPLSTRVLIFISVFLSNWGLWLIGGLIILTVGLLYVIKKSKPVHFYTDRIILRLPLVGKMIRYYNVANASRTLGLLLKSGSKLSEALLITADTTPNLVYKKEFTHLASVVERGERMSVHLKAQQHYFPDILGQMVAVGEKSGSLSDTLVYLSEMYEAEVEEFTKNLSSMIEPVLMIIMGIMVGFIAISVITPIYGITQHLQPK